MSVWLNREKPDLNIIKNIAKQIEALELELSLKDQVIKNHREKIEQYEKATGVCSSKLPKYPTTPNLEKLKCT